MSLCHWNIFKPSEYDTFRVGYLSGITLNIHRSWDFSWSLFPLESNMFFQGIKWCFPPFQDVQLAVEKILSAHEVPRLVTIQGEVWVECWNRCRWNCNCSTLPETNSQSTWKMDGCSMIVSFWDGRFFQGLCDFQGVYGYIYIYILRTIIKYKHYIYI